MPPPSTWLKKAQINPKITAVMMCPKCQALRCVPSMFEALVFALIAVHRENDPNGEGMKIAKALAEARAVIVKVFLSLHHCRS